jgi:hypothetical protein
MPKYVPVSQVGVLLPHVKSLIALLAKVKTIDSNGRVVMATGHANPQDHVLLAREARAQGVEVMLTHPSAAVTMDMKKEVASLGGYIEVMADFNQWGGDAKEKADYVAEVIKGVGPNTYCLDRTAGRWITPSRPTAMSSPREPCGREVFLIVS